MGARRQALVVLAAGILVASVAASPAAAKVTPTLGDARCTINDADMRFTLGLRNRDHIEGRQKNRGARQTNFNATLSNCTTASGGALPDGIDRGILTTTGKVPGGFCEKLGQLKLNTTIFWQNAEEFVAGSTRARLSVHVAKPGFMQPWTLSFSGTARPASRIFPRDSIAFSLTTTTTNDIISGSCFRDSLYTLEFATGTLAVDLPS